MESHCECGIEPSGFYKNGISFLREKKIITETKSRLYNNIISIKIIQVLCLCTPMIPQAQHRGSLIRVSLSSSI